MFSTVLPFLIKFCDLLQARDIAPITPSVLMRLDDADRAERPLTRYMSYVSIVVVAVLFKTFSDIFRLRPVQVMNVYTCFNRNPLQT